MNTAQVALDRAWELYQIDRYEQAVAEMAVCLAVDPDWAEAHSFAAFCHLALGRRDEALRFAEAGLGDRADVRVRPLRDGLGALPPRRISSSSRRGQRGSPHRPRVGAGVADPGQDPQLAAPTEGDAQGRRTGTRTRTRRRRAPESARRSAGGPRTVHRQSPVAPRIAAHPAEPGGAVHPTRLSISRAAAPGGCRARVSGGAASPPHQRPGAPWPGRRAQGKDLVVSRLRSHVRLHRQVGRGLRRSYSSCSAPSRCSCRPYAHGSPWPGSSTSSATTWPITRFSIERRDANS